jgi:hypothetical protein
VASTVHSAPTNAVPVQIESQPSSARIFVRVREIGGLNVKFTPAGIAAVLATLSTYYSGLSTTAAAALTAISGDQWCSVSAYEISAAVAPGDLATVAASLSTNVKTSGSTVKS